MAGHKLEPLVCAFKNSIGEVLPKIYFKSQVEKLSFLIQALQSIKASKNYSSFMVWHPTYNPNIQELLSLNFTHNISTKGIYFIFLFLSLWMIISTIHPVHT